MSTDIFSTGTAGYSILGHIKRSLSHYRYHGQRGNVTQASYVVTYAYPNGETESVQAAMSWTTGTDGRPATMHAGTVSSDPVKVDRDVTQRINDTVDGPMSPMWVAAFYGHTDNI